MYRFLFGQDDPTIGEEMENAPAKAHRVQQGLSGVHVTQGLVATEQRAGLEARLRRDRALAPVLDRCAAVVCAA